MLSKKPLDWWCHVHMPGDAMRQETPYVEYEGGIKQIKT